MRSRVRPDNVGTDPLPSIGLHRGSIPRRQCTEGQLQICEVVGAGLSATERQRMTKTLESLQRNTSPFAEVPRDIAPYARWVHSRLVGDVEYREYGGTLRHPLAEEVPHRCRQLPSHSASAIAMRLSTAVRIASILIITKAVNP